MANTDTTHSVIPAWTVGDRLAKALTHSGVSVQEMADYLDVSRNTVGNYTAGRTTPRRAVLLAWALRTGVPAVWLTDGIEPEPGPNTPEGLGVSGSAWTGNVVPLRRSAGGNDCSQPQKIPA